MTSKTATDLYVRYQPLRPYVEVGFWVVFYFIQAATNSWIAWIDLKNVGLSPKFVKIWEPMVWHAWGNITLLALVPTVVAFEKRFPLHWSVLRRHLPYHLLASMIYCIVHFFSTTGLILVTYDMMNAKASTGNLWNKLVFQYLRDIRFYFFVIIVLNFYRFLLLRMQGEASLLDKPEEGSAVEPIERPERFLVRKMGKEFLLPASDIEWIQACGNYVNLRVRGHDYPLRSTMTAIEARLDPKRFMRVHRSYIANLDLIREIEMLDSGDARTSMIDGSQIPVSRRYLDQLRKGASS